MATFSITDDNNIALFISAEEAVQAGTPAANVFDSQAGLAHISAAWRMKRFVEIYNGIAGHGEIQKFANRNQAVARIWSAIQPLASRAEAEPPPSGPTRRSRVSGSRRAKSGGSQKAAKRGGKDAGLGNKKAAVITMMKRANGVTLSTIMRATGWQAHTVRGFVSILGSQGGEKIESFKNASGDRIYRITK